MPTKVVNPNPLVTACAYAAVSRVPAAIYGESTAYANGGYLQALSMVLRGIAPLYSQAVGANGQAMAQNPCSPSISTGGDKFAVAGGVFGDPTGAPTALTALYDSYPECQYGYVNNSGWAGFVGSMPTGTYGIDLTAALRAHLWGVSSTTGGTLLQVIRQVVELGAPDYSYLSQTTRSWRDTSVHRLHYALDLTANPSRAWGVEQRVELNNDGDYLVTGSCFEQPGVLTGFGGPSLMIGRGGLGIARSIDSLIYARQSHAERWKQQRDVAGANGVCLTHICYGFNDVTGGAGDGDPSYQYSGFTAGAITSSGNTVVLDDTTGRDFTGYKIALVNPAISANDSLNSQNEYIHTVTAYNLSTKTATVDGTWGVSLGAGLIWRAGALSKTGDGMYANLTKMCAEIRTAASAAGMTPKIWISPAWRASAAGNTDQDNTDAAAMQFAADNSDVCCVNTNAIFPYSRISQAFPNSDRIHIGGYAQAAIAQASIAEALRAGTTRVALVSA